MIDYVSQAISDLLCGPDPGKSKHEYGVNLSDGRRRVDRRSWTAQQVCQILNSSSAKAATF